MYGNDFSYLDGMEFKKIEDRQPASVAAKRGDWTDQETLKDRNKAYAAETKARGIFGKEGLSGDQKKGIGMGLLDTYMKMEEGWNARQQMKMNQIEQSKRDRLTAMQDLIGIYQRGNAL